jgi:tetratricopeptide (TPR) repeat protein
VVVVVSAPLAAQTTGRISGTVLDSAGRPIPNVTVVLARFDINRTHNITVRANGSYLQVGLDPREYELTVSADGYVTHKETVRIPLGDALARNIVLRPPEDQAVATGQVVEDRGATTANVGVGAYNEAVALFNQRNHTEALARLEVAINSFDESLATATSDSAKTDIEKNVAAASKLLAFTLFEIGKTNPGERSNLWLRAEPILKASLELTPNDASIAQSLSEIAGMRGDREAEKMYSDLVEKIEGPKVENAYNRAVDLFNAGEYKDALPHLKRAVEINPSFAETYYLLGICEFSEGNISGAKTAFQQYLRLAPNGKYASDVKEMLADPTFR